MDQAARVKRWRPSRQGGSSSSSSLSSAGLPCALPPRCLTVPTPQLTAPRSAAQSAAQPATAAKPRFNLIELKPAENEPYIPVPANVDLVQVTVFYYEDKKKVWKRVEGPTDVDTAKGSFCVKEFDPDHAKPPYFKELPM